jgi:antitoxin (DNA-binding transcriptional repressor) of toxin-antitoxin stability system
MNLHYRLPKVNKRRSLTSPVQRCTFCAVLEETMKLSISEVRKRLPALVRQVRRDAGASVQITVHDEVVAELRAVQAEPEPGAAAAKLLQIMAKLPKRRGRRIQISSRVNEHLYGTRRTKRS